MRFVAAVLAVAAALTVVAMIWLWPRGSYPGSDGADQSAGGTQVGGQVLEVRQTACPAGTADQPGGPQLCGTVTVRVGDETVNTDIPSGPGAPTVEPGDRVKLIYTPDSPPDQQYQIMDHQRGQQLWFLLLAFALAVIAFGRWRGLAALAGLAVTFGVLLLFIVPSILDGHSPLLVAIVGSAAIMLAVLYLTHGFTVPTTVAVLGTLTSLTLTGALSALATAALHLTGVASEEDSFLSISNQNVNMQGLLLAGILIGSLGVLDDIAVTQAATVDELALANPSLSALQLYRAATRVGRAHISSVINTIILAYAGASLPLLLLIAAGNQPLGQVLTTQLIAQEITRSIIGTLGLIAAVPITTGLAAAFAARSTRPSPTAPPSSPGRADLAGPVPFSEPAVVADPAAGRSGPVSPAPSRRGPRHAAPPTAQSTFAAEARANGWLDATSDPPGPGATAQ